jgi:AcrR family transcriptional regulator
MARTGRKTSRTAKVAANNKEGWQAEKSAMTRQAILDAAIQCFIELGYANTTTALIAEYAGVSRGAMMHHFPSRASVLKATIGYLHKKRLEEYSLLMKNIDNPSELLDRKRIEASVEAAWKFHSLPTSIAFQEVMMASRTDAELKDVLEPLEKEYEKQFLEQVKKIFPHWEALDVMDLAHDVVHFLLGGMMLSHMKSRKQVRSKRILKYLADSLEYLYTHAESTGDSKASG